MLTTPVPSDVQTQKTLGVNYYIGKYVFDLTLKYVFFYLFNSDVSLQDKVNKYQWFWFLSPHQTEFEKML